MAKPQSRAKRRSRKRRETLEIPYILAAHHRVVCADDATVSSKTDILGTMIQVRFIRLETVPMGESIPVQVEGGFTKQIGPAEFMGTDARKAVEVDVLLRPDHAFAVAQAILTRLEALDPTQRARYRIPEIKKVEVEKEKEGVTKKRKPKRKGNGTRQHTS